MSAELAMITGLALTAFMGVKLSNEFKKAETMLEEAVNLLSFLFLIGLLYAGHGISQSASLSNARDAYLVGLIVAVLIFLGLMVKLVHRYWVETRDNSEFGYFDGGG